MEIYKILTEIMNEQNLSVAETARKTNLPDSTVRGIITRKQKTVALEVAFKLAHGLHVSLERLNGMPEPQKKISSSEITPREIQFVMAYRRASNEAKNIINVALEPYMEEPKQEKTASVG